MVEVHFYSCLYWELDAIMPHVNVILFCRIVIRNLVMNMQESFHQGSVLGPYVVEDKDFVLNSCSRILRCICCMQSIYR